MKIILLLFYALCIHINNVSIDCYYLITGLFVAYLVKYQIDRLGGVYNKKYEQDLLKKAHLLHRGGMFMLERDQ